jgi:hypothetical protein
VKSMLFTMLITCLSFFWLRFGLSMHSSWFLARTLV